MKKRRRESQKKKNYFKERTVEMARSRSAPKAELETKHVAGVSFTSLALHLSMLIVGALYNDNDSCKLEASE